MKNNSKNKKIASVYISPISSYRSNPQTFTWNKNINRRTFLKKMGLGAAGVATGAVMAPAALAKTALAQDPEVLWTSTHRVEGFGDPIIFSLVKREENAYRVMQADYRQLNSSDGTSRRSIIDLTTVMDDSKTNKWLLGFGQMGDPQKRGWFVLHEDLIPEVARFVKRCKEQGRLLDPQVFRLLGK